ncbi:MAG: helix-turn-helix transcriptional regulator [Gammaproteobacteria bacterium]|nr:helix-turn-helix transcriptional regulator [Gammaproteobacteria bacterium]MDP2347575.1 helix-turn-helix transcriptional regulator [Gammaproteobacteria bacterium]
MTSKIDYKVAPPDVIAAEVGDRIATARLQRNITQGELAEQSGIAIRTLRRLEAGQGGSIDTLIRLLQALGAAHSLDLMLPESSVSPMAAIQKNRSGRGGMTRSRQRARKKVKEPTSAWSWDEGKAP